MARFAVVLDTCALVPFMSCDVLLTLADAELYQPIWSEKILRELRSTILKVRTDLSEANVDKRLNRMRLAFPEAAVESDIFYADISCPDPNDWHVIAAAIAGRAELIVTENLRDFPPEVLEPLGLTATSVDEFLLDLYDLDPDRTYNAFLARVTELSNPPLSIGEYVATLSGISPKFAEKMLYHAVT